MNNIKTSILLHVWATIVGHHEAYIKNSGIRLLNRNYINMDPYCFCAIFALILIDNLMVMLNLKFMVTLKLKFRLNLQLWVTTTETGWGGNCEEF
jgi:hypothetical protein